MRDELEEMTRVAEDEAAPPSEEELSEDASLLEEPDLDFQRLMRMIRARKHA